MLTEEEIVCRLDNPDIDRKEINKLFDELIELRWNSNCYIYGTRGCKNVF